MPRRGRVKRMGSTAIGSLSRPGLVPSVPEIPNNGELLRPVIEIAFVEPAGVDAQDLDHVAQLASRRASSIEVPAQLAQDRVLGAFQVQRLPGAHLYGSPSCKLASIERRITLDEQIDLGDEGQEEDVP